MKNTELILENKKIKVYPCEKEDAPIVFSNDFEDEAEQLLDACKKLGVSDFHLVSITGLSWDEELSPWASPAIVSKEDHFTGGANSYLKQLEETIVPYVKDLFPSSSYTILHGYSMGGLFALYAAHTSTCFDAYVAPSASVWYPDFVEYVESHGFVCQPKSMYLSLGDRESRTKHPALSQTQSNMERLEAYYTKCGITSIFELNPGNHFKNTVGRIAKGIAWTLKGI